MNDFQLGPWTVHANRHRLVKDGVEVRLEPRAMQVLVFLAERAGEVVSKPEILDSVWADTYVSDESLTYAIWEIRRTLGDDAKNPTFVQTIPKKGYRLIAPVGPPPTEVRSPSNRARSVAALVGFVMVSVAAWYVLASRYEPDAKPGIGASGRPTLALAHFEDHTGLPELSWLSRGAPSMLITSLAQTPGVDLVSLERLEAIARENEDTEAVRDGSRVVEIARHAGAGAVVVGSIFRSGTRIRIDVQLQEIESGRVLLAHSESGDDVFAVVDRLSASIRDQLELTDYGEGRRLADLTTGSLEAYRHYSEGLFAERNARWADARARYQAAIRIDPNFAMAYFRLSQHHDYTDDETAKERYRQRVIELLDRLPDRQRLYVEAAYEDDPGEEVERWRHLLELYPDEEDAYRALSSAYLFKLQQPEDAFDVMRASVVALPRSGSLRNEFAYQLMERGRFQDAIDELEVYRQIHPREPNPYDSLGHAYLVSGDPERAIAHYAEALKRDPSFLAAFVGRATAYGMLGRFDEAFREIAMQRELESRDAPSQFWSVASMVNAYLLARVGRYREAEAVLGEMLARDHAASWPQALFQLVASYHELERGRFREMDERVGRFEDALDALGKEGEHLGAAAHLLRGAAAARQGQLDTARSILAEMEGLASEDAVGSSGFDWWLASMRGELALAEENWSEAERIFARAEPKSRAWFPITDYPGGAAANLLGFRDGRARAELGRGNASGAIRYYRTLLEPGPENPWAAVLEPRYVLAMARILEASGNRDAAAVEYRRFLELWKDADADEPELSEARAALRRAASD